MIIYKNEDGEFREVVRVSPDGDVSGDSSTAESLREIIEEGGFYIPNVSDSPEDLISEGDKFLLYLDQRFNTGYYSAEFEEDDYKYLDSIEDDRNIV